MHLTNELFQQYTQTLQKQNHIKYKQNQLLHGKLKTVLEENNKLKDKLYYSKSTACNQNSILKNIDIDRQNNNDFSESATSINQVMTKMAKSQLIYNATPKNKKMKTEQSSNENYQNKQYYYFPLKDKKHLIRTKTQTLQTQKSQNNYFQSSEEDFPLQMQQILEFVERVQCQTQYISQKYHQIKKQRDSYLTKIKRLQNDNSNLKKILSSQLRSRKYKKQLYSNKQNQNCKNFIERNSDRGYNRKIYQISGQDIINFKPGDFGKLFFKEKIKTNINESSSFYHKNASSQNKLDQKVVKEKLNKNQRFFVNSYRNQINKFNKR